MCATLLSFSHFKAQNLPYGSLTQPTTTKLLSTTLDTGNPSKYERFVINYILLDSESWVTNPIRDIDGQIKSIDELLADTHINGDVRSKLEETKSLLTDLETKLEVLHKEIHQSRKRQSLGIYALC